MAITPPRSGVQLLNPASLIGGQQQRNNGLDQFINFALQQKLQQSSQAFQGAQRQIDRDLDMEKFILGAKAQGSLFDANDPRLASLPGEANLTRVTVGDDTFVLGREVEQATSLLANSQTVTEQGGRQFFEGTTQGDINGPSSGTGIAGPLGGTGSQAASRLDDLTVAPKEDSISQLEAFRSAIEGRPELEGLVASVDQHIATVQADNAFSRTEANALNDKFGLEQIRMYVDSVADLEETDRALAGGVGEAAIEFRSLYEIQTFDEAGNVTGRRDLNPYEAHILGKVKMDVPTTDQEFEDYTNLPPLLGRRDILDVADRMLTSIASGQTDASALQHMLQSVNRKIFDKDSQKFITDHPLYLRIEEDMSSVSTATIDRWLQSPASMAFHESYALHASIGAVSRIQEYERDGGHIPFNVDRAIKTPGSFVYKDVEYAAGLGRGTQIQGTFSAEDAQDIERAAREFINAYRNAPELLEPLDVAINSGDYSTMVAVIQEQIRIADAIAADQNVDPVEQEFMSLHSQNLSFLASQDSVSLAALSSHIRGR